MVVLHQAGTFRFKLPDEEMDDYDDYSETFIQAAYKAMKGKL